jgi:hypothetical protein
MLGRKVRRGHKGVPEPARGSSDFKVSAGCLACRDRALDVQEIPFRDRLRPLRFLLKWEFSLRGARQALRVRRVERAHAHAKEP